MRFFTEEELECQHCGARNFDPEFLQLVSQIREDAGFAFPVSSGYRCPEHPIEAKKKNGPGAHSTGKAIDIAVSGERALKVNELALAAGVKRIGVNQKGAHRFIHLDVCDDKTSPTIWSY